MTSLTDFLVILIRDCARRIELFIFDLLAARPETLSPSDAPSYKTPQLWHLARSLISDSDYFIDRTMRSRLAMVSAGHSEGRGRM